MSTPPAVFQEATLGSVPLRDLGLSIRGTRLEPVIAAFEEELRRAGISRVRPHFYLSTEWGVPFGTVSIALPFYLAREELLQFHADHGGFVEGQRPSDILRYLRHEMGHVLNYAYQLYEREDWVKHFGSITQPYEEEYRPDPFSRRFVCHLPGWYAQKHPDEDWAETFAVWLTPGRDWRSEYAGWPEALAKLNYCDRLLAELKDRDPPVTATEADEDVSALPLTLEQLYHGGSGEDIDGLPGLDGALRAIFEEAGEADERAAPRRPAASLLRRLGPELAGAVYQWTGHFPERTQRLVRQLAARAEQLRQVYPEGQETSVALNVTALVTALAMNHLQRGSYLP